MKKILLIGPLSPPITGNSLANDVVFNHFNNHEEFEITTINTQHDVFKGVIGKFTIRKALFSIGRYLFLYKLINKNIIYITPGQTFFGVVKYAPFIYLSRLLKKKIIIHIHGNYLREQYELLSGLRKKLFKHVLSQADTGVVLSNKLRANLTQFMSNEKIHVVPNFVEDYLRSPELRISPAKTLKISYLSNLMEEKGIIYLLKALKRLSQDGIDFEAKIAGKMEERIAGEIKPYLSTKNITYLGVVSGQPKKELLRWSNIFVLPTFYKMEGVPISVLEALANGNLIITTQHAGITDVITEDHGFFVAKRSSEDIYQVLLELNSKLNSLSEMRQSNIIHSKMYSQKNFTQSLINIFLN